MLHLEAVYYAAVVLLEIPSGAFSDRFGRTPTLRISAALGTAGFVLFAFGPRTFASLATAQALWASAYAFLSGTDTAWLYDHLREHGRTSEFTVEQGSRATRSVRSRARRSPAASRGRWRCGFPMP